MTSKYCGIGKMPKNSTRGSMRECAEKGQVRYYGIVKVDPKTMDLAKRKDVIPESREQLLKKMVNLRGIINRNKGRAETTKDPKAKVEYLKVLKKAESDLKKVVPKLKKIEKQRDEAKVPRAKLPKKKAVVVKKKADVKVPVAKKKAVVVKKKADVKVPVKKKMTELEKLMATHKSAISKLETKESLGSLKKYKPNQIDLKTKRKQWKESD